MEGFILILFLLFYCAVGAFCGACMASCVFVDCWKVFTWPPAGDWFIGIFFFIAMFAMWPGFLLIVVPIEFFSNLNSMTKVYMTKDAFKDFKVVVNHLGGSFCKLREL